MIEIIGSTFLWALFLSTLIPAVAAKGFRGALVASPLLALLHVGDAPLTRAKAQTGLHSKDGALPTE
jgi:hypothetical protein